MLGSGHWGDVIITEAPDYLRNDGAPILREVAVTEKTKTTLDDVLAYCILDHEYRECLIDADEELKRLRSQVAELRCAHTLVACTVCGRGVRNQHSVAKMCPTCAEAEIERLRGIERAAVNVYDGTTREEAISFWRQLEQAAPIKMAGVGYAIAAALEKAK